MIFSNDVRTEISRVFTLPSQSLPDKGTPLLYLIRKDLEEQYGSEANSGGTCRSPLLTCLGIMIGFDLLSKMWSGNHQAEMKELIEFLEKIAGQSPDQADALAQFRHALVHGYRLSVRKKKGQEIFTFQISDQAGATLSIEEIKQKVFQVN